MADTRSLNSTVATHWETIVRAYCALMDAVMPYLSDSEQIVYHRLFRLSHVRQSSCVHCRYEELAGQCGLSLSTVRRAVQGLRTKQLIKTLWQSHSGTTFEVPLPSTLPPWPASRPGRRRAGELFLALPPPRHPPVYEAFSPEDRALFLECKHRLGPARLNELTEAAVEWLTARWGGDAEAFSDELLRDKVDELIFDTVFGPERRKPYEKLFAHLYQTTNMPAP
jgi:hypothetical protein